jgi:hypothetical protein
MTDFDRLLQGTFKLSDLSTPERITDVIEELGRKPDVDLDCIRDETTRNIMKRWAKLFPST